MKKHLGVNLFPWFPPGPLSWLRQNRRPALPPPRQRASLVQANVFGRNRVLIRPRGSSREGRMLEQ